MKLYHLCAELMGEIADRCDKISCFGALRFNPTWWGHQTRNIIYARV